MYKCVADEVMTMAPGVDDAQNVSQDDSLPVDPTGSHKVEGCK